MSLPNSQIALIHVAKRQLALDDASYRDVLARVAGVASCRDLDKAGFDALMAYFEGLGFRSEFGKAHLGNRRHPTMASPPQLALIVGLWAEYTDGRGDERSLGKWLHRQGWASALRFLAASDAKKAIGALRRMQERKAAKADREGVHGP